jgi:hypothetical protein
MEVVIETYISIAAAGGGTAMILKDELGALIAAYLVFSAARIEGVFAFVEAAQTNFVLVLIQTLAATSCLDK